MDCLGEGQKSRLVPGVHYPPDEGLMEAQISKLGQTLLLTVAALSAVCAITSVAMADSVPMKSTATYKGTAISTEQAAKRGLACVERADGSMSCYDTEQEAVSSSVARSEAAKSGAAGSVGATISKNRRRAKVSAEVGANNPYMWITRDVLFNNNLNSGGWSIFGSARQNWYDMTGSYRNAASSVSAGNHSGYLADSYAGAGTRWRVDLNRDHAVWTPNDRADSRYRN